MPSMDARLSKRSTVLRNVLRRHAAVAIGLEDSSSLDQWASQIKNGGGSCGDRSSSSGCSRPTELNGQSSTKNCESLWDSGLPSSCRRAKTCSAPNSRLECKLYAMAYAKRHAASGKCRQTATVPTTGGNADFVPHPYMQRSSTMTADPFMASDPLIKREILVQSDFNTINLPSQSTSQSEVTERSKNDMSPAILHKKYKERGLHAGHHTRIDQQSRPTEDLVLPDCTIDDIRNSLNHKGRCQFKSNGLRSSMPNISFSEKPTKHPSPEIQNDRNPLLVSGLFQIANDAGRSRGDVAEDDLLNSTGTGSAGSDRNSTSIGSAGAATETSLSWQQLLALRKIPTVTKPPTISTHATGLGAAGSISLPQRKSQSKMAASHSGGRGSSINTSGFSGTDSIFGKGKSAGKKEAVEPRYPDALVGAPAYLQTRLAELASLESETVRWERTNKTKKKSKDKED